MSTLRRSAAVIFCAVLLSAGCANVGPPPGGPEDVIAPELISNYPEAGAVNVKRRMVVDLEFSEPVNRSSVENALFLSPDPLLRLRYRWSGRKLKLVYLDPLEEDRTYVISVGSEARDLRGNPFGETTTIAFTTGSELDRGRFQGWMQGVEKPQAISIWAYRLDDVADPDPMRDVADYRVQAREDGGFRLEYLRIGRYRVLAVADKNRDALWNPSSEWIGTPPWDIVVTDSTNPWVSFQPMLQDTAPVIMRRTRQIDANRVDLRFSRETKTLYVNFVDSLGTGATVADSYVDPENPRTWRVFVTESLHSGFWFVSAQGVDELGRRWESLDTLIAADKPDTSHPTLLSGWPSSKRSTVVSPDSIFLEFSEPVVANLLPDSTYIKSRSETLSVEITQNRPRTITFRPAQPLDSTARYHLTFAGDSIRDLAGHPFADSLYSYSFSTLSADSLGTLLGRLNSNGGGHFIVELTTVGRNRESRIERFPAGAYVINGIPAGKYVLSLSKDENRDGEFSRGRTLPFTFSEPFITIEDTVTIRARWETEFDINWLTNP